ncbi:putative pentatricopeptide repeat-containing protein [Senna tora]|uniref:Putative pentatricopeptide repeat-containing protein n=1 Tax=Senna tora TaxID=362788 RepID=A0A834TT36_9FABA|nr:putative pentatricopeptide repeat-containing protein [Senna tora]
MLLRRTTTFSKTLSYHLLHRRPLSTSGEPITPVNPDHLLRVCTILYQQQNSPDPRLHSNLRSFHISHEFFLQVCNRFPYSWRPVYRFFHFTQTLPRFTHTSVSFNKMLDVIGKSRNIDLFWELLRETGRLRFADDKTFRIALRVLGAARELKKCVEFFRFMNSNGYEYNVGTLNKVVETMCGCKLVVEARFVVFKLKKEEWIQPNGDTYKHLIRGFCDGGDFIEASRIWNLMVDEGFKPDVEVVEKMMVTFFKINRYDEALKLFQTMRVKRMEELGVSTYRLVIKWMCKKKGMVSQAHVVFDEMRKRGIHVDNLTWGFLIYGILSRGGVREAYRVLEGIEEPDISVFHGMIKGLLRLRRVSEATQVFREMIKRGCEPTMHTYVMLLQGHMGKRGRKGSDPLINFDTIFVGGLVKAGKSLEATKYVERMMKRGLEVPRFDYNKFLHYYSNEEGVVMFEEVGKKFREVGLVDLADIFERYGQKMATRDRRRNRTP